MKLTRGMAVLGVLALWAAPAQAQMAAPMPNAPVADALRFYLKYFQARLIPAADDFPASKYRYKPTSPQQSVGYIVDHLAGSNNFLCAAVAGVPAPVEPTVVPDSTSPDSLKARMKRSFTFCETVLAKVDDSKLADSVPFFGNSKRTRANLMLAIPYDWGDHYSQFANYLRLNGISPPNARARATPVP